MVTRRPSRHQAPPETATLVGGLVRGAGLLVHVIIICFAHLSAAGPLLFGPLIRGPE